MTYAVEFGKTGIKNSADLSAKRGESENAMKKLTFKKVRAGVVVVLLNGNEVGIIRKELDNNWYIYVECCARISYNVAFTQLRFAKTAVRSEFEDGWSTIRDEITNGGY